MAFILLTHERELGKASNSGQLIEQCLADTLRIVWQRAVPDPALLQLISQHQSARQIALVYPGEKNPSATPQQTFRHYILIDSTWQEARKIYNRSPYLHSLPCVQLPVEQASRYTLRRNQKADGLCTAETAMALLAEAGDQTSLAQLETRFNDFISGS
ncbi:MAG TPA: tRNA-uridine aminocarboxypropyltransferase [Gammaproteobacteria bacterium]